VRRSPFYYQLPRGQQRINSAEIKSEGGFEMKFFREKIERKEVTVIVEEIFNP